MLTQSWSGIPLQTTGAWGSSQITDVEAVVKSARECALIGVKLSTIFAPERIVVEGRPSAANPSIWVMNSVNVATIVVTSVDRQWAQLAYQFGHEFGHVICNSWLTRFDSICGPSHWLEEALVESFSLHTIRRMGQRWRVRPPRPNWKAYGSALTQYTTDTLRTYGLAAARLGFDRDPAAWFLSSRDDLASALTLTADVHPIVPWLESLLTKQPSLKADLAALNLWAARGAISLDRYLSSWFEACRSIKQPGRLPLKIAAQLGVNLLT